MYILRLVCLFVVQTNDQFYPLYWWGGLEKKRTIAIERDVMKNMNNLLCTSQQGDFILVKDEDLVPTQDSEVLADSGRNAKAAGASGIMDRKEVLGGT